MSYTPTVWRTGDIITAEKLNKIEEGIANAGQPSWETVFEGSVTTSSSENVAAGTINYSEQISADTIKVTFNGTEYECAKINAPFGGVAYGGIGEQGYDFSEYPFVILSGEGVEQTIVNLLVTETADTYSLKIKEPQSGGASDFSTAEVTIDSAFLAYLDGFAGIGEYDSEEFIYISYPDAASEVSVSAGTPSTITVILYKDIPTIITVELRMPVGYEITATGNATVDGDNVSVTGDCTITISTLS